MSETLLPKPPACQGCPYYGDGLGFVPDRIRPQAEVLIYAQGPGDDEEHGRRFLGRDQYGLDLYEDTPPEPLIGKTGRLLDKTFLPLAGLNREEVSLANTFRCRLNHSNKLPELHNKMVRDAVAHCTRAHWRRPEGVKLIVAMGEYASYAMGGLTRDFNGWRGYLTPYQPPDAMRVPMEQVWTPMPNELPVFVTYHLAYLFREPEAELPAKRDWNKIASILDRTWPESYPGHETNPEKLVWMPGSAFDTEYVPETGQLIRFSVATPDRRIFVIEWQDMIRYRYGAVETLQRVLPKAAAIVPVYSMWGAEDPQCQSLEALPRLLPEGLRGMGQEAQGQAAMLSRTKVPQSMALSLRQENAQKAGVYSQASQDWSGLTWVPGYGKVPALAMLDLSEEETARTRSLPSNGKDQRLALLVMQPGYRAAGGQPIPSWTGQRIPLRLVGHHTVVDIPYLPHLLPPGTLVDVDCSMYSHACLWTGRVETDDQKGKQGGAMSHTLNFLGSMYARINRWKHLSKIAPVTYAGGDAMGTMDVWATGLHGGLQGELERDPQSKWVYENLQKPLVPIILRNREHGIRTDPERAKVALKAIVQEQKNFVNRAQAYCGWQINLRSPKQLAFWLFQIEGLKLKRQQWR